MKFYWQNGYGVFSIYGSQFDKVRQCILKQENHQQKMTYAKEVNKSVKSCGIKIQTP